MSTGSTWWDTVDVDAAIDDVVAVGDDLSAATLLGAYRNGCFPWPSPGWPAIPWCSPEPRAVLPVDRLTVGRTLRGRLRRCGWTTTLDVAFDAVIAGCADRPDTWITPEMRAAYSGLHGLGFAHSVEVWFGNDLVGGLYGVQVGAVFSGESMFHREADASKVALIDLVNRFAAAGGRIVDCQQETEHLLRLGLRQMSRRDFVATVRALRERPVRILTGRYAAARLAP